MKISIIQTNKTNHYIKPSFRSTKSGLVKDCFCSANNLDKVLEVRHKTFVENFLKNKEIQKFFANFDFTQFGKEGIPLKYSRPNFIDDVLNIFRETSDKKIKFVLKRFNLKSGDNDIDGVARLSKSKNEVEENVSNLIKRFYFNNESNTNDSRQDEVFNTLVKGFPEFNMTIGKKQHQMHVYSVDVHSLGALKIAYNQPEYEKLSEESKIVLQLATLMHDFGKKGNIQTPDHPSISKVEAEEILKSFDLSDRIKLRILNLIENHHWLADFTNGKTTKDDVSKIFQPYDNVEVAKIFAKGDIASIHPYGHLMKFGNGKLISQKEFDDKFYEIVSVIK